MSDDYLWEPEQGAPDSLTRELEAALRPLHTAPPDLAPIIARARLLRARTRWLRATTTTAGLVAAASMFWVLTLPTPWKAVAEQGEVRIDNLVTTNGRARQDTRIETGANGRASLNVGRAGVVSLSPDTRVRVEQTSETEHRISLDYGVIHARIVAPPRFFVIRTASADVIDLGCVYSLSVDSAGNGALSVAEGSVELARNGARVIVPAGYTASLHRGRAPGVPIPLSASPAVRGIVSAIDSEGATPTRIDALLQVIDSTGTITLWHLLPSLNGAAREALVARLSQIVPLPESVSRAQIVARDSVALAAWQRVLAARWSPVPTAWWRRQLMRRGIWAKPAVRLTTP
jgi:hypothetical protein